MLWEPLGRARRISRSYYAAYSFVGSVLASRGLAFPADRVGPDHALLPDLIRDQLGKVYGGSTIKRLRGAVTAPYRTRVRSDYHPHVKVNKHSALEAERLATAVRKTLSKELP
jgi:hypothetical protein